MPKNLRQLFFLLAGGGALLGGLILLLVALSSPADTGTLLSRGALAILAVTAIALVAANFWFSRMRDLLRALSKTLAAYGEGRFGDSGRIIRPEELADLSRLTRDLGARLEQNHKDATRRFREEAREVRDEALRRMGSGLLSRIEKSASSTLGFVNLSLQQPLPDGPLQNYLRLAEREARTLLDWLGWLRQYLRSDSPRGSGCQLNDVVQRTVHDFAAVAKEGGIAIRLNLAEGLPLVAGEEIALGRVISVLIDNASEAMAAGGGMLEIGTNRDGRGRVVATFRDNGPGFDEGVERALFSPFFSTKPDRQGLSLALAATTVRLLGGFLTAWSQPGRGATFFLTLPTAEPNPPPAPVNAVSA